MIHLVATLFFLLAACGGIGMIAVMLHDHQSAIAVALGLAPMSAAPPTAAARRVRVRRVVRQPAMAAAGAARRAA